MQRRQAIEVADGRILGIIRVQAQRLDCDYLRVNAPVLDVPDLLARALGEAAGEL